MLVHGAPQMVQHAVEADENLVQMPRIPGRGLRRRNRLANSAPNLRHQWRMLSGWLWFTILEYRFATNAAERPEATKNGRQECKPFCVRSATDRHLIVQGLPLLTAA